MDTIQCIREKYDPLYHCIAPHITIVFPFDSDISTEALKIHFHNALQGNKKFNIQLKDFTGDCKDGYLFLNIRKGNDSIIELHDLLYSGIISRFLYRKSTYFPHVTVGRLRDPIAFDKALKALTCCVESFETLIDKVYVETIDGNENSIIEFSYDLA